MHRQIRASLDASGSRVICGSEDGRVVVWRARHDHYVPHVHPRFTGYSAKKVRGYEYFQAAIPMGSRAGGGRTAALSSGGDALHGGAHGSAHDGTKASIDSIPSRGQGSVNSLEDDGDDIPDDDGSGSESGSESTSHGPGTGSGRRSGASSPAGASRGRSGLGSGSSGSGGSVGDEEAAGGGQSRAGSGSGPHDIDSESRPHSAKTRREAADGSTGDTVQPGSGAADDAAEPAGGKPLAVASTVALFAPPSTLAAVQARRRAMVRKYEEELGLPPSLPPKGIRGAGSATGHVQGYVPPSGAGLRCPRDRAGMWLLRQTELAR